MALIDYICNNVYQEPYCYISNNIFVTLFSILTKQIKAGYGAFELVGALTGNILLTEGSILFVFLGVLM